MGFGRPTCWAEGDGDTDGIGIGGADPRLPRLSICHQSASTSSFAPPGEDRELVDPARRHAELHRVRGVGRQDEHCLVGVFAMLGPEHPAPAIRLAVADYDRAVTDLCEGRRVVADDSGDQGAGIILGRVAVLVGAGGQSLSRTGDPANHLVSVDINEASALLKVNLDQLDERRRREPRPDLGMRGAAGSVADRGD
jgi:hypothetical protein